MTNHVLPEPLRPEPLARDDILLLWHDVNRAMAPQLHFDERECECWLCRRLTNHPLELCYDCWIAPDDTVEAQHAIDRLRESALRRKDGRR